jgi:hypothetical protein
LSPIAKTVCAVGRAQRPPEFVATLRDADTETCRTSSWPSATAAIITTVIKTDSLPANLTERRFREDIRYAGMRVPLPRVFVQDITS